tara:strand:- start:611 stop:922 length:312 start_codon:yes stop_codon:yes gene_type:complete
MSNQSNISKIAQAVAHANANGNAVPAQFKGLIQELREEHLAENVVVEHGLLPATSYDVNDEVEIATPRHTLGRDSNTETDFDNDENLVDMDSVSGSLRDIFND